MESLNGYITLPNIQAQVWVSLSASELLSGQEGGFGSSPGLDAVRRFSLRSRAGDPSAAHPARGSSILLIEDNLGDVGLVREALQEHGVEGELLVIQDGESAVRFIQALDTPADRPELIILDLNLPKLPGREVLKAMRQSIKYQDARIVILTSSDAPEERAEAVVLGASLYLRKPSNLEEFLSLGAVFRAILEAQRQQGPDSPPQ